MKTDGECARVLVVIILILAGCSSSARRTTAAASVTTVSVVTTSQTIPPTTTATVVTPAEVTPNEPPSPPCTVSMGRHELALLLDSFESADARIIGQYITTPQPHQDGLESAPTLTSFISSGSRIADGGLAVHTAADLQKFALDVGGHHFELTSSRGGVGTDLQSGPGAFTGLGVTLEITWRATTGLGGDRQYVYGGGKTIYRCDSGLMTRALLSPISFQPIDLVQ